MTPSALNSSKCDDSPPEATGKCLLSAPTSGTKAFCYSHKNGAIITDALRKERQRPTMIQMKMGNDHKGNGRYPLGIYFSLHRQKVGKPTGILGVAHMHAAIEHDGVMGVANDDTTSTDIYIGTVSAYEMHLDRHQGKAGTTFSYWSLQAREDSLENVE